MTTNDAPVLRQNVRWGEEYVSRGLNAKLAGIISPGVYHGFVLKPGGMMAVLVDHEPDYPRSVAVVERDGYSLTVVMDDPGRVHIPATGTWFVCIEAHYSPTQQGYQRIVVREKPEPHHIVLGKVRAGVPLTEPGETEPDGNNEGGEGDSPTPGVAVVITQEMISAGELKVDADRATLENLSASISAHNGDQAAHGFDNPNSPLRKAIAAEATAAVNEKIGAEEGQINLLAHALTHAQDGVDPITPESIGAASIDDPRLMGAITASRIGMGLHMEGVGEGDESQTLLTTNIATLEAPGINQPDGTTTTVNENGLLSAIGGNLLLNDELWITESGTFTAPFAGTYEALLISGGNGGSVYYNDIAQIGIMPGASGSYKTVLVTLQAGEEVPVVIGSGGLANTSGGNVVGGNTQFGDYIAVSGNNTADYTGMSIGALYFVDTAVSVLRMHGCGFGGAYYNANGVMYGSGGSAEVQGKSSDHARSATKGAQGAVRVRFHNPSKASGPAPQPAFLSSRRMASRAATAPVTVNLYDPETGQGSVWREEDTEAKLAEGLITEAAWLAICAARAAEERAAWLADPETEVGRFAMLRQARDAKLTATDYLVATDYPLTDEQRAAVIAYRQALRDLPAQAGAPWDGGGELTPWPEEPVVRNVQAEG